MHINEHVINFLMKFIIRYIKKTIMFDIHIEYKW